MKAKFSEFSFGFALAFELMNAIRPIARGVPFFPSLREEAEKGFDVDFTPAGWGWPLFLQFKVAEYLGRRGSFSRDHGGQPYFRINLYKRTESQQHRKLKALAEEQREVYYAAPTFIDGKEFNRLFANDGIFTNTVFIPLLNLPDLPDDAQHYITYTRNISLNPSEYIFHSSNSQRFNHPIYGEEWLRHIQGLLNQPQSLGWNFMYTLRDTLYRIAKENTLQRELFELPVLRGNEHISVVRDIRELLATQYETILFFVEPLNRKSG